MLDNALGIREYVIVLEAHDLPAARGQIRVSRFIAFRIRVLAAVYLHNDLRFDAGEIDDVRRDGMLTSERDAELQARGYSTPALCNPSM